MGLSNYELVLLDNLVYLKPVTKYFLKGDDLTIGKMVDKFLKDGSSSGGKCFMSKQEWLGILNAIDENGMVNGFNQPVSISPFTYMFKDFKKTTFCDKKLKN